MWRALLRMHMSEAHHHGAVASSSAVSRNTGNARFSAARSTGAGNAVLIHLHAAGRLAADSSNSAGSNMLRPSHVEIHDIVQQCCGSIDLVHGGGIIGDCRHSGKGAPCVGIGRLVANHLQVISAIVKGEPERDRARRAGRTLESVSAANLLVDLIQYGDLADVIESDGRILMPERARGIG